MKPLRLRWLRTALLGYSPEWTAGVRRHPGLAAALPAATIGCAFVPYAGFPALAAAALLCAGLYARNEPLPLLLLCECSGARLLVRKIGTAWRNYFLAALPAAAPAAALIPDHRLAALWLPFAALPLLQRRNANTPADRLPTPLPVHSAGFAGFLVPVFLPVTLCLTVSYAVRAERNLDRYLYDYD